MSVVTSFAMPKGSDMFVHAVLERCEDLIESGIWDGIERVRVDRWINNFKTPAEKYFGASILDALIYRSERHSFALMGQILQRVISDRIRIDRPSIPQQDWLEGLRSRSADPSIRLVPVIKDSDPPTKSGPLMARLYRREFGMNDKWMCWPWQIHENIDSGAKTFLLVDDFLGTGTQFTSFCKRFEIAKNSDKCAFIYAPLAAHEQGLEKIKREVPEILVCPAEIIDPSYNLFSEHSRFFRDEVNNHESVQAFYKKILGENQFPMKASHGFGSLCVAYSFSHATPNNCTPLLWRSVGNWAPLFDR